ncbi:MAG: glycoside hydrolase family 10 protein [Candidatus Melainabacteria bacterium]
MRQMMKTGWFQVLSGVLLSAFLLTGVLSVPLPARAQVATNVVPPSGEKLMTTGQNISRGEDTLILYDRRFGQRTKTNGFGVEVIARPVSSKRAAMAAQNQPVRYQVVQVTSVWECQKANTPNVCGNAMIPADGLVLSAAGGKREVLLKALPLGAEFTLAEEWFANRSYPLTAVNPSDANNPGACGFPGCRGSNQLVLYNRDYPSPTTLTNEYGFEVTVQNNRVISRDGSDSAIPAEPNSMVLSGHGKAREWLITNAPIGAKIMLRPMGEGAQVVTETGAAPAEPQKLAVNAVVDFTTYTSQIRQRMKDVKCLNCISDDFNKYREQLNAKLAEAEKLNASGKTDQALRMLTAEMETLNHRLWREYPAFPQTAVKGIWHRPVEQNRAEIAETLDFLQNAGLNTIFLESFFHGFTIFPSQVMQHYGLPAQSPKFAGTSEAGSGKDYLALWIDEAHKRHMKVHIWFQTFYAGTNVFYTAPGPILGKYPQWANVQYSALSDLKPPVTAPNIAPGDATADTAALSNAPPAQVAMDPPAGGRTVPSYMMPLTDDPQVKPRTPAMPVKAPDSETGLDKTTPVGDPAAWTSPPPTGLDMVLTATRLKPSTLERGAFFIDPVNAEARQFLLKLIDEMATRYDIDGMQLDYIRYPASFPPDRYSYHATTWGYTPTARLDFYKEYGVDPVTLNEKQNPLLWQTWENYKASFVSGFVRDVHTVLQEKEQQNGRKILLSAVVFPKAEVARQTKHQDWKTWLDNQWLDFLAPITLTSSISIIKSDTEASVKAGGDTTPVATGVFGPFNNNSAEDLLAQIEAARQGGAAGFAIFDTAHLSGRMAEALQASEAPRVKP